jgi:RHS repeat-associated protein
LLEVAYPEATVSYTYDAVGNRLTERRIAAGAGGGLLADKSYGYDDRDRLLEIVDAAAPAESAAYRYDANGNQVARTRGGLETRYRFDSRDQLVGVEEDVAGGGFRLLGRYLYDWRGLRVEKRWSESAGDPTLRHLRFTWDGLRLVAEHGADGATVARYAFGADGVLEMTHSTEGQSLYLVDALGTPTTLLASDASVRERVTFDAWGEVRNRVGGSENRFGFTGHELDEEGELYYAKARFFDSRSGRFASEDPFAGIADTPPSLHRYLYAYGNPTVFADPNGEATVEVFGRKVWMPDAVVDWTLYQVGQATGLAEQLQHRVQSLQDAARSDSIEPAPILGGLAREAQRGFERNGRLIRAYREGGFLGLDRERQNILTEAIADAKTKLRELPVVRLNAPIAEAFDAQLQGSSLGVARAKVRFAFEATEDALLIAGTAAAIQSAAARTPAMASRVAIAEEAAAADVVAAQNAIRAQAAVEAESVSGVGARNIGALDSPAMVEDVAQGFVNQPRSIRAQVMRGAAAPTTSGYAHLRDPSNVGVKPFTRRQHREALAANRAANQGVLRSDRSGRILAQPQQSKRGRTPPINEANLDHVVPMDAQGTNSYRNLQILARDENLTKRNKREEPP